MSVGRIAASATDRRRDVVLACALSFVLALTYVPVFMSPEIIEAYTREDRVVEALGALFFFMTAVLFFVELRRSLIRNDHATKKLSLMMLSTAFLLFALEEISWGQRVFGFESSGFFSDGNLQKETNLHNMNWFAGGEATIPVNLEQLFVAFLFTIGLLIPALAALFPVANRLFRRHFIVLSLALGFVLAVNYGLQKALLRVFEWAPDLYQHATRPPAVPIYEIREHGYALVFFALAAHYLAFSSEPTERLRRRRR